MKPRLKEALGRHLLKVLAVIFSVSLWFYVLNSESKIEDVNFKLEFQLPETKAIAEKVTREVKVTLKGPRAFIRNLQAEKLKIFVDLKDLGSKKNRLLYHIDDDNVPIPFGVEILEIQPSEIGIVLGEKVSKKVPIKPNFVGELGNNLKLQKFEIIPSYAVVEGPEKFINAISELKTRAIDLSTLDGQGSLRIQLVDLDERVITELPMNGIDFNFIIKPKTANVTLKNIDILFLSREQNFISAVKKVALDVLADDPQREIKKSEVRVVAEIPDGVKEKERIKLKATLPEGVHLLQIHPEYINVAPKKLRQRRRR